MPLTFSHALRFLACTILLLVAACGGDGTAQEPPPPAGNAGHSELAGSAGVATAGSAGSSLGGAGTSGFPDSTAGTAGEAAGAGALSGAAGTGVGGAGPSAGAGGVAGSSAGSAGSAQAGAGGSVTLPKSVTGLFPAPNSTGVCLDAPLTITFNAKPTLGTTGKIAIFAHSNPSTAIDTVDLAVEKISDTIGGQARNEVRPVFIDGNQAVVYFHQRKLSANTRYFVTVSAGAFLDASKAAIGSVANADGWSFTTGPAPIVSASLTVDRTGAGSLCTVQGAFDLIPANNTAARTITIKTGTYHEILYLSGKQNITVHGQDRAGTVLAYPNNDLLNAGTSARPLLSANSTTGLVIENLTVYNTTPQGGSQSEALKVQGDQVILRNANFKSLQDTLLLSGRVYVVTSYIDGNVDFVWGTGVTYFDRCEIKTVGRAGAIVQSRNGAGYGYVFVDSKLTSDAGVTGQVLARIDATAYPQSHVAFINCQMSSAIAAKGWTITPVGTTQTGSLRFWEYQSTDANGTKLDVSGRDPASKQISASQAATMRDKATVLAGWNPQ